MVQAAKEHGYKANVLDSDRYNVAKDPVSDGRCNNPLSDEQLELVDNYAICQAKTATIAEAIGVDYKWMNKHYGNRLRQKRAEGKLECIQGHRKQALSNPVAMMFWTKQHLGYSDKQDKPDVHVTISHGSFSPVPEATEAHEKPVEKESENEV